MVSAGGVVSVGESGVVKTPRPCVTVTRLVPLTKISCTLASVGPMFVALQVVPPLSLAKTPTSVPA